MPDGLQRRSGHLELRKRSPAGQLDGGDGWLKVSAVKGVRADVET